MTLEILWWCQGGTIAVLLLVIWAFANEIRAIKGVFPLQAEVNTALGERVLAIERMMGSCPTPEQLDKMFANADKESN